MGSGIVPMAPALPEAKVPPCIESESIKDQNSDKQIEDPAPIEEDKTF